MSIPAKADQSPAALDDGVTKDVIVNIREMTNGAYHYSLHTPRLGSLSLRTTAGVANAGLPALEGAPEPDVNLDLLDEISKTESTVPDSGDGQGYATLDQTSAPIGRSTN
jgi:hypothetical protein